MRAPLNATYPGQNEYVLYSENWAHAAWCQLLQDFWRDFFLQQ